MAGIIEYFHGEGGRVTVREWVAGKELLHYVITLEGNHNRGYANDYGSDIGIDPLIKPGDEVEYLRLDQYSGIWVKRGHDFSHLLDEASARVRRNRRRMEEYGDLAQESGFAVEAWLDSLAEETGVPARMGRPDAASAKRLPGPTLPPISVFLSYSHKNALPARRFFELLLAEAKSEVWMDLAQPGESLDHEGDIARWLKEAIDTTHVFVVLLTREAASSAWVKREIAWAAEKAQKEEGFHLVALKLDDAPTPKALRVTGHLVDGSGLSDGELFEELYAAVYKRRSRREWLGDGARSGPAYFKWLKRWRSDYGVAVALRWAKEGKDIRWTLDYTKDGKEHRAEGRSAHQVVDLGIRPGDKIGYFIFSYSTEPFTSVWMRSADLSIMPNAVVGEYERQRRAPTRAVRALRVLLIVCGMLIIGLVAGFYYYVRRKYAVVDEPIPGVDARLSGILQIALDVLFAFFVMVCGAYPLSNAAHPIQFEDRSDSEARTYVAKALKVVFLSSLIHSFVYTIAFLLFYAFTVGLVLAIYQSATGVEGSAVFFVGFLVVYGGWILYCLRKLWVERPEYWRSPEFSWWL